MGDIEHVNPGLMVLFRKLISDEKLAAKFSNCQTLDEFYDFCTEIVQGYTKKELHEFLVSLSLLTFNKKTDKIILKNNLEKVSGGIGMNNISKKYLSGILGVLSLASVPFMTDFNVSAVKPNESATQKTQQAAPKENIWARLAEDLAVGSAAGVVVGTAVYYALSSASSPKDFGLPNMGASCFMNAVIQQLYSIKAFREAVMKDTSGDKKAAALRYIFSLMNKNQKIKVSDIKGAIYDLGYDERQEDAAEFLINQAKKDDEHVGADGLGELLTTYGLNRMFSEPLNIANAPNGVSLIELLKHGGVISVDLVHKKIRESDPETKDWANNDPRWPDKREEFLEDPENAGSTEFNRPAVIEPAEGQFGVLINRTLRTSAGKRARTSKIKKVVSVPEIMQKDGSTYYLTGAMVHMGRSMNSGHYYSYKRNSKGQWICYNDSQISQEDDKSVKNDIERNGVMFIYTVVPDSISAKI